MEWGEHLPLLEKVAKTGETPQVLKDRPELPWHYSPYLLDFSRLSATRTFNMSGPNPLDLVSVIQYNKEVSKVGIENFIDIMLGLDAIFITKSNKKTKPKQV